MECKLSESGSCAEEQIFSPASLDEVMASSKNLYLLFERGEEAKGTFRMLLKEECIDKDRSSRGCSPRGIKEKNTSKAFITGVPSFSGTANDSRDRATNFLQLVESTSPTFDTAPAIKAIRENVANTVQRHVKGVLEPLDRMHKFSDETKKTKGGTTDEDWSLPPKHKIIMDVVKRVRNSPSYHQLKQKCLEVLEHLHGARITPLRGQQSAIYQYPPLSESSHSIIKAWKDEELAEGLPVKQQAGLEGVDTYTQGCAAHYGNSHELPSEHRSCFSFDPRATEDASDLLPAYGQSSHKVEVLNFNDGNVVEASGESGYFVSAPIFCHEMVEGDEEALFVVKKAMKSVLNGKSDRIIVSLFSSSFSTNSSQEASSTFSSSISSVSEGVEKDDLQLINIGKDCCKGGESEEQRIKGKNIHLSVYNALKALVETKLIETLVEDDDLYWEGLAALVLQWLREKIACETPHIFNQKIKRSLSPVHTNEQQHLLKQLVTQLSEVGSAFQLIQLIIDLLELLEMEPKKNFARKKVKEEERSPESVTCSLELSSSFSNDVLKKSVFLPSQPQFSSASNALRLQQLEPHPSEVLLLVGSLALQPIKLLPHCWISLVEEEVKEILYFILKKSLCFSSLFARLDSSAKWLEGWIDQRSCVANQLALLPFTCPEEFALLCQHDEVHVGLPSLPASSFCRKSRCMSRELNSYQISVVSLVLPLVCGMHLSPSRSLPTCFSPSCLPVAENEPEEWVEKCVRSLLKNTFSFSSLSYLLKYSPSSFSMIVAGCYHSRHHFFSDLQSSVLELILNYILSLSPRIPDINGIVDNVDPLSLSQLFQLILMFLCRTDSDFASSHPKTACATPERSSAGGIEKNGKPNPRCNSERVESFRKLDCWVASLLESVLHILYEIFREMSMSTSADAGLQCQLGAARKEEKSVRLLHEKTWNMYRQYLYVLQWFCIVSLPHAANELSRTLTFCLARLSDPSLREFFFVLSPTKGQLDNGNTTDPSMFCAFCPSFSQVVAAASIHPQGWVQIRQWCEQSYSCSMKRSGEASSLFCIPSSGFLPLCCLTTYELLFSILTVNCNAVKEQKMIDAIPLFSPLHCHPYYYLRKKANGHTSSNPPIACESFSHTLDIHTKKYWLHLLSVLPCSPLLPSSSSSSLCVCTPCAAMYRPTIQDWATSHFLLQRWSTVSTCFWTPSLSEVVEEVRDRIAGGLASSSFVLPAIHGKEGNLFRILPAQGEDLHWASMFESQVGGVECWSSCGSRHCHSSFSHISLSWWQSCLHFLLLLESPFPSGDLFSYGSKNGCSPSIRYDAHERFTCSQQTLGQDNPKIYCSRSSLLSRAIAQLGVWLSSSTESSLDMVSRTSGISAGCNESSGLFSTLSFIAWGLWLTPINELPPKISPTPRADKVSSTKSRSTTRGSLLGGILCGPSRIPALEALLRYYAEWVSVESKEDETGGNIIHPCSILLATIIVSFFGVLNEGSGNPSKNTVKAAVKGEKSERDSCPRRRGGSVSSPLFSNEMIAALVYLLRDGEEVDWKPEILYAPAWQSLLEECAKGGQYSLHHFSARYPLEGNTCTRDFNPHENHHPSSTSKIVPPCLFCSTSSSNDRFFSLSLDFIECQFTHSSHWKRCKHSFSTTLSAFIISYIQSCLVLLVFEEEYRHYRTLQLNEKETGSSYSRGKGKHNQITEEGEECGSRVDEMIERIVTQCSLRSTEEWELFIGRKTLKLEAVPPIHSSNRAEKKTSPTDCSSVYEFKTSSVCDHWNLVREVVEEMLQKQYLSQEAHQTLHDCGIDLFWLVHVLVAMCISPPLLLFSCGRCTVPEKYLLERGAAFFVSCRIFLSYGTESWKGWIASKLGIFMSKSILCDVEEGLREGEVKKTMNVKKCAEIGNLSSGCCAINAEVPSKISSSSFPCSNGVQTSLFQPFNAPDCQYFNDVPTLSTKCTWMLLQAFYNPLFVFSED